MRGTGCIATARDTTPNRHPTILCDQAASQVHDGIIPLEDTGLMLRGIDKQPLVGYLSHLEVLRYTKVSVFWRPHPPTPVPVA